MAGQTAMDSDGETFAEQFDAAAATVVEALGEAGGRPEHIVSMQIFTTDVRQYRREAREIGEAYRRNLGRHVPAMALLGVSGLFDPAAKVEPMAQLFATEVAQFVVDRAVQTEGARALEEGHQLEHRYCEVRAPAHLRGHLRDPAREHRLQPDPRRRVEAA